MKRHLLKIVFITFSLFLLSACNVEGLLEGALEIIGSQDNNQKDEQINEDNDQTGEEVDNNGTNDDENEHDEASENNQTDTAASPVKADSSLPFDERLISQGYEILYRPNGFPFEVPYHWIYVKPPTDDKDHEGFLGTFCFDLPLQVEDVAHYFNYLPDVQQTHYGEAEDIIHHTSFTLNHFIGEPTTSHLDFYLDEFGNSCVDTRVDANLGESVWSDLDSVADDSQVDRTLPKNYDQVLGQVQSGGDLKALTVSYDDIVSVRDRIYNRQLEIDHLVNGHPVIFPYEWYLVSKSELSDGFTGEFCTDTSMHEAILKHHDMLKDMHANIEHFSIEAGPKENVASETGFSFNDAHGTGSWSGVSMFYANPDPDSEFPNHNCVRVEMVFSTDFVN